jgi:hypothetical protein
VFRLLPREEKFFDLFEQQAGHIVSASRVLEELTLDYPDAKAKAERIKDIEHAGDTLTHEIVRRLNTTFLTPIDREDIFALSRAIDDILDYAYSTVDEMITLEVEPNEFLLQMASTLKQAAEEIRLAVLRLQEHPKVALDHATHAKRLENQTEAIYREAVAALFKSPKNLDDIVKILKMREIYRHMSNAADRGDEAANIISNIVVKTT